MAKAKAKKSALKTIKRGISPRVPKAKSKSTGQRASRNSRTV